MTIETKTTKNGNVTVKVDGERTSIKNATIAAQHTLRKASTETLEIVSETGEKFTFSGHEIKQCYCYYYFNNDNGKSFEIHNVAGGLEEVAKRAIDTVAKMHIVEEQAAQYKAHFGKINAEVNNDNFVAKLAIVNKMQADGFNLTAEHINNFLNSNTTTAEVNNEIQEETKMTIETKISANGSANIYVDGKKTANAAAVEIAEANGLPTYEARVYTYGENCLSKEFATAIAAHKWLVGKMKRDIAASVEIHRWNNRREEATIFADADQSHTINADDEPEFANYIYPLFTAEHIESQFDRMNNFAAQLTREGLTAEQINEVLTAQYANQNGNAHCKLIAEFKKANAAAEAATVTEVNAFNVETKITADNKVTFAHAGKKISLKKAVAQAVETDADYIRIINENGEQILYAMHDDCGWNPETSTNFYWNLKVFADDFARGKIDPKTGERKAEVKSVDFSDEAEADEPQGYIFSKTLVSSGYSAHNNAHYSKLERIDKECKILGNSEQTNGSIYREVAFYNADHAHSWAVKTSDGKIIISGKDKPDFDKIVAAVNNAELQFDLNRFDEPVNNGDTPSPENKEDTSMTNTKPTATTDEIREACMEAQTQLETKIAAGAPESEVKAVVDKDGNKIKPTTPLTTAEMNAAIDRLVAEFDREQAEAQKPLSLADLKAKYDASEDEAERVAIAINAYRKFLEPEKIKQERQIAEQVCASLTADAPQGWAVTFTDKGNYEVTAHGLSAATLDTITAGDFINPKAFFAKFNRTQADIDNERETAIAELKNQREQLQNMRAELVADFPNETDRLKILDEMIAETDQDIAVFENLAWKPGMFDDKHFNEDNLPF